MAETYLLEANDLAKNLRDNTKTLVEVQQTFAKVLAVMSRTGSGFGFAAGTGKGSYNPTTQAQQQSYLPARQGSYLPTARAATGQQQSGSGYILGNVMAPGFKPPSYGTSYNNGGAAAAGGGGSSQPPNGGGGGGGGGGGYNNGGMPPAGSGGSGGGGMAATGGGGYNNGGVPPGSSGSSVPGNPFSSIPPTQRPTAQEVRLPSGIGSLAGFAWDFAAAYGDSKRGKMQEMHAYASRAARQMPAVAYGGDPNRRRDAIRQQTFGQDATSSYSFWSYNHQDAQNSNWMMGNLIGTRNFQGSPQAQQQWRDFTGLAAANPYASATSTANLEAYMRSPQAQRRSVQMGIGDTYAGGGKYKGTIDNLYGYLDSIYGPWGGEKIGMSEFMKSMKPGQLASASFENYTAGMDEEMKSNVRAQLDAIVTVSEHGLSQNDYKKALTDLTLDDAVDGNKAKISAAQEKLKKAGLADDTINTLKRSEAVTNAKDANTNENFMGGMKTATEHLTTFNKAFNNLFKTPFGKWLVSLTGYVSTVNPSVQNGLSIGGSIMDSIPGLSGAKSLLGGILAPGGTATEASSSAPLPPEAGSGKPGSKNSAKKESSSSPNVARGVIDAALSKVGVPYSWGGGNVKGPTLGTGRGAKTVGFDCSSLVQYAYWQGARIKIPRDTWSQMNDAKGRNVSAKEAQPGDLIYTSGGGHVKMLINRGAYVHAPQTGKNIQVVRTRNPFAGAIKIKSWLKGPRAGVSPTDVPSANVRDGQPQREEAGPRKNEVSAPSESGTEVIGDGSTSVQGTGSPSSGVANSLGSVEEVDAIKAFFGSRGTGSSDIEKAQNELAIKEARDDPSTLTEAKKVGVKEGSDVKIPSVPKGSGTAESNKKIGKKMAAELGWTGKQWRALEALWQRESGWNHKADNPTSDAYGIPQALPGSKMASAGKDWATNPATQIEWGLGYIKSRYKTPAKALDFWQRAVPIGGRKVGHWYEQGAWEIPEDGHQAVLHKGEMVVPRRPAERIRDALLKEAVAPNSLSDRVAGGGGGGGGLTFNFGPGSIQLTVGAGANVALARQTASEVFSELERLQRTKRISKGR
ncbi:NlpC/P60 family protein [Streptosporangium sp. NPDC050855]|uniref:aggregation-promoting factor C-terminal-like domain-containing protein n=1 Tax=Streptosporangium sp. NPDC050855 TaxID=3366194 RepID=UPI0037B38EDA